MNKFRRFELAIGFGGGLPLCFFCDPSRQRAVGVFGFGRSLGRILVGRSWLLGGRVGPRRGGLRTLLLHAGTTRSVGLVAGGRVVFAWVL